MIGFRASLLAAMTVSLAAGRLFGSYTFTTLDFPTASSTYVQDISGNMVVGFYQPGDSPHTYGFSLIGGIYTTFQHPLGARGTMPTGIDGSTIVGYYEDFEGTRTHGFVKNGDNYTTFDIPQATVGPAITGISGGTFVGWYVDAAGEHGFTDSGGSYTTVNVPGARTTQVRGIRDNTIFGAYGDAAGYHGFTETDDVFTTFDYPFATDLPPETWLDGISGDTVVGTYWAHGEHGNLHGFMERGGVYTMVEDPLGVGGTEVCGIDGTSLFGNYIDANGRYHGFIATLDVPEPASLALFSCGALTLLLRPRKVARGLFTYPK